MQEFVVMKEELNTEIERSIFKFEMVINYLNKETTQEKSHFIWKKMEQMNLDYKTYIEDKLIPALKY